MGELPGASAVTLDLLTSNLGTNRPLEAGSLTCKFSCGVICKLRFPREHEKTVN